MRDWIIITTLVYTHLHYTDLGINTWNESVANRRKPN